MTNENYAQHGTTRRPVRLLLVALLAFTCLVPWHVAADDIQETFTVRFTAEGRYGIAAQGVGLAGSSTGTISLTVPGTAIEAAYLYWTGYDDWTGGDDTVALAVDGSTVAPALVATDQFGPAFWYDGFHYFVWLADVTSYVQLGAHTYTISDFDSGVAVRSGAGLMVMYQDEGLPYGRVELQDGLDRFYRDWGEGSRGETAVNCFTFDPAGSDRTLDFVMFVADIHAPGEPRPDALWYLTGSAADPMPLDMVNAPNDGPVIGNLVAGPPNYPFQSSDGPQWDSYENAVTIPAGDSWACFQIESAEYLSYQPASGVGVALAGRWRTLAEVDLEVTKGDNPDPVVPGQQLTYLLHYANNGPGDAENVVITDLLPPEVTFIDAEPDPSSGPNPLTWDLGTVLDGEEDTIAILVGVQPWVTQTFTNSVTITTNTPETDYSNNQDDEPTEVLRQADVTIAKIDYPDPVVPGETLTYTLHYTNNGPSPAENVVITDQLPPEVAFVDADPDPASGPNPLTWNLGVLDAGEGGSITVIVSVHPWVTETFTNTVSIATATPETDYANNQDNEPTQVTPEVDVSIAKTDEPDPVIPGQQLVYTLSYSNQGPSNAQNVVVSDLLPPEVTFVEATPSPAAGPNPLIWNLGPLAAGESGTILVTVLVKPWVTEPFTNTASITTDTTERDYTNNQDQELTDVTPQADVSIVKQDERDPVRTDEQVVYNLVYTNNGPSDALDVVVSDLLPPEVIFLSANPAADSGPNPLIWNLGTLEAGETGTIQVRVAIVPYFTGTFTNSVCVSTETPETDYTNNSDEEPTSTEGPPTLISLLYFRGTPAGSEVLVEWATAWELDNWGFSLYRSQTPSFLDAGESIHFAQARGRGQFDGEYYRFVDRSVTPGQVYYYWLEDTDIFGITTRHGPIRVANLYRVFLPTVGH